MLVLRDTWDSWCWLCDRQAVRVCEKSIGQRGECEAVLAGGEGRVASLGAMLGLGAARRARRPLACRRAALWGVGLWRAPLTSRALAGSIRGCLNEKGPLIWGARGLRSPVRKHGDYRKGYAQEAAECEGMEPVAGDKGGGDPFPIEAAGGGR